MAEEEKKKVKKVMIVPPPPGSGDGPVHIVMKGDPSKVIKVVTKKETTEVDIRDENVQEILTSVPHWMIRWGNVLFLGLILMIIGISWMVQYPDVVSIPLTVQSTNPDAKIMYSEEALIKNLLVKEDQYVTKGTPLLVFENDANTEDVQSLQKFLNSIEITSQGIKIDTNELGALKLGNLQIPFAEFQADYQSYSIDKNNKNKFRNTITSLEKLNQKLKDWSRKNVINAPVSGNVKLSTSTANYQTGDIILKITSNEKHVYFSQIISESNELQKIRIDQEVQVSLSVYPEHENGVLLGKVTSINWDTSLKKYIIQVSFPDELKTTYGVAVNPETNLNGIANIITKRKRLIERFFSSF